MKALQNLCNSAKEFFLRSFVLVSVIALLGCVPNDKDDDCTKEDDHSLEAKAKWSCTNEIGQTYYSQSPAYCAAYYPKCAGVADMPAACITPNLKKRNVCSTTTTTSTTTSTSTSTSTKTDTYVFPELPGKVCTVDKFRQAGGDQSIKKVDILFVMDHSGSMQDDWERVANNIQHLVRELPSATNVRYAVLLADVGAWKGKLYAPVGSPVVLDNQKLSVDKISKSLHKTFVEAMKISDSSAGEASFFSLYHAATTNAVANQKLGFFRPDAALSVIFMSDEQEVGFPFPSRAVLAAQGLPPRCDEEFEEGVKRDYYDKKGITLDGTFNALKALKGDMPVKTHAFINITKEDLFRINPKNAKCLYDSLGYGYREMVEKTKGVLFSIQDEKSEGLARCGKAIKESLELQHDFNLSKPADKVDPATILATVDASLVPHEYRAASNSVHLNDAGHFESQIEIRHCEPMGSVNWSLASFTGTPAQYSVGLSWQTAEFATNGKVYWGVDPNNLVNVISEEAKATNHAVTVSGLTPNTVYFFQAYSWDEFGQAKRTEVKSFRTLPDWSLSGISAQAARFSATVSWNTSEYATKGRLLWGAAPDQLTNQTAETAVMNAHVFELTGLAADSNYFFQCVSRDEFGLEKRSEVLSLRTQPDWGVTGFAGIPTRTSVALSFGTPDQAAIGSVIWGSSLSNLSQKVSGTAASTQHALTISGLAPDTDYYFQAVAQDSTGAEKRSPVILVHTNIDWMIAGFAGTSTQTEVSLGWSTAGYATTGRIFWGTSDTSLNNVVADSVIGTSHSAKVTGLSPDTVYYFQASSVDAEGIEKRSSVVAIRTQQIPLPTWTISGFAGSSNVNSVALSWKTDQYSTLGKVIWGSSLDALNGNVAETAPGTVHSLTVSGLAPDTIYYFQAVARDDRGQEKVSDVIAVRTMAETPVNPPATWVISGFDGTTTATQANLIWQTPGASTKATIKVGLSANDLSLMAVTVDTYSSTHVVGVNGLNPNTVYYFQVIAADSAGRTVESLVISKKTKAQ